MESRKNCHAEVSVRSSASDETASSGGDPGDGLGSEPSPYFARAFRWQWWAAALLSIPALPVVVVAMLLVRCTSRGPALYRQTRVGLHGQHFQVIKIRTMRIDAESETGAVWTTTLKDPRITLVGCLLRWTHIDELPQLWNVLRGEMALVGPRPERPEFTGLLAQSIPGYLNRLSVLPGVTGLAQVNLPADTGLESVRKKLSLDLQYVGEGNFTLDMRIIICTAARLFGVRSFWLRNFLHVAREVESASQNAMNGVGVPAIAGTMNRSWSSADSDDEGTLLSCRRTELSDSAFSELANASVNTHGPCG